MKPVNTSQIRIAYHTRMISLATELMAKTHNPISRDKLQRQIDNHRREINKLDRTATTADEAARRDSYLVRT